MGAPPALLWAADHPEEVTRLFYTWFYEGATALPGAIEPEAVDEILRTFSGTEGVLGALGVYRAAFVTMAQTAPLAVDKVRVPIVALGGEAAQGGRVRQMVELVAMSVEGGAVARCGHFVPEECPDELVRQILNTRAHAPEGARG